jgi:hypothetical protein
MHVSVRKLASSITLLLSVAACDNTTTSSQAPSPAGAAELATLQSSLAQIQYKAQQVSDANAIKRLQRAYGYYLEEGMWDEVANLFADSATIELARDGVYRGKTRIRDYLYALGKDQPGLREGQLNEHLMVMPVVTVAPDGQTAKARWRDILLLGQLGEHAELGEGPYENEYVKENGVWKFSKMHWQQAILVPYKGGWAANEDYNQGLWASKILPPDAPPTDDHGWWPETYLPPFHFANPVATYVPTAAGTAAPATKPATAVVPALVPVLPTPTPVHDVKELGQQVAMTAAEIARLEAENAIENLQGIFGFYYDKNLWQQAADVFTDDATFEWGGSGVYVGKAHILAYLQSLGAEGPQEGVLNDQMQLQPIVTVAADGLTAKGRWHLFSQEATHGVEHFWGTGVYENEYRFEAGVWKLSKLKLYSTMLTPYGDGWGLTALPRSAPSTVVPPDQASSTDYQHYPAVFVPPFHYQNPVTMPATPAVADASVTQALTDVAAVNAELAKLSQRADLLQDADAVERLHTIYGYYLAHNKWDELTGIFTEDGTIEIALRGVYKGRASVRRNLDLYGVQDELKGTLHNHMQYQPVIHIADDGQSALMRSRAFSLMGNYGGTGRFMGGTYENLFLKRDGVWQLHKDQQMNTYFAEYNQGWKDLVWRAAPGITAANPPDAPPSTHFEMYPKAFLPPFHYKNPVSGK